MYLITIIIINFTVNFNRSSLELRLDLKSPELELELKSPEMELELKLIVSSGIGIENNGIGIRIELKQGKSEGFDSCDRPSNLTQIGLKSSIFQPVWPWNLMDDPEK